MRTQDGYAECRVDKYKSQKEPFIFIEFLLFFFKHFLTNPPIALLWVFGWIQ